MKKITSIVIGFLVSLELSAGSLGSTNLLHTKVIADLGGYSISEYLPSGLDSKAEMKRVYEERRSKKLIDAHFPVRSQKLKVGRLSSSEANDIRYQMTSQPIFIIGYDPVSIDWLKANRGHLNKNKAIGLVVNVENAKQMESLQEIAGKQIRLQPTPGDEIAAHLKIAHYPFYMDNKGVMR